MVTIPDFTIASRALDIELDLCWCELEPRGRQARGRHGPRQPLAHQTGSRWQRRVGKERHPSHLRRPERQQKPWTRWCVAFQSYTRRIRNSFDRTDVGRDEQNGPRLCRLSMCHRVAPFRIVVRGGRRRGRCAPVSVSSVIGVRVRVKRSGSGSGWVRR